MIRGTDHGVFFVIIAAATRDILLGGFIVVLWLPIVLLGQAVIRWFLKNRTRVWVRRSIMLIPAFIIVIQIFHNTNDFGGRQKVALKVALSGQLPNDIHELYVQEYAWTDHTIIAYFRSDPNDLKSILEDHPFERWEYNLPVLLFFR